MPEFPFELPSFEQLQPYLFSFGRAVLILLAAFILARVSHRIVRALRIQIIRVMMSRAGGAPEELEKRAATLGGIIRKTASTVIYVIAAIMVLAEFNVNIAPILAGAGVIGLAVGFGAQNLVRDVITGLFILLENQIRVNDVAIINGTGGLVEEINLRTTVLRSLDGTVHIFPNGTIERLSNMTREYSYYLFDIGVAYKEDTDRVVEAVKEVADGLMKEEEFREAILAPLEVLGVDQFADSAVVIKARIKTRPIKQWMVGREMNRRIKKKFDELGIEIPFPHFSLYFGEASKPIKLQVDSLQREQVRALVREVVEEFRSGGTEPFPRS